MSSTARFTLTCPSQSLAAAQQLSDKLEDLLAVKASAVAIHEADESQGLWNMVAYFASEEEAKAALWYLNVRGDVAPVAQVDWVRRSLEGLAPVTVGRFQLHGSHDRQRKRPGGHSLEIDAGTAFGTGHHGTTVGCLLILDAVLKRAKPQRIFDLGCGTGVLALAAARATRAKVLATDIDPEAVRVTKLNAARNFLGPQIHALAAPGLHHPAIHAVGPFDLIFANILARPLASLAQDLSRLLAPGGMLVLSGLTRDQLRWISACYRSRGLISGQKVMIGNWVTLALHQRGATQKRPRRYPGR